MSQTNCDCSGNQSTLTLPIRGIGLTLDTSSLPGGAGPEPGPEGTHLVVRDGKAVWEPMPAPAGGRIRVSEDLHLYVNGDTATSGDGLTPETAVKTYAEAVDVAARYDGGNKYDLRLHFASLAGGAVYPQVTVTSGHHALFWNMYIAGESRDSTRFERVHAGPGSMLRVENLQAEILTASAAHLWLVGRNTLTGRDASTALSADFAADVRIMDGADLLFKGGGVFYACLGSHRASSLHVDGTATIRISPAVTVNQGFVYAHSCGCVHISSGAVISGTVTGKKYDLRVNSCLTTPSSAATFLPGSLAGVVATGGVASHP